MVLLQRMLCAMVKIHKTQGPRCRGAEGRRELSERRLLRIRRKDRQPSGSGAVFSSGIDDREDECGCVDCANTFTQRPLLG